MFRPEPPVRFADPADPRIGVNFDETPGGADFDPKAPSQRMGGPTLLKPPQALPENAKQATLEKGLA